jgi:fructosamine-3-kinase
VGEGPHGYFASGLEVRRENGKDFQQNKEDWSYFEKRWADFFAKERNGFFMNIFS